MYEYTDPEILLKGMQLELDYFNQLITTLIWIICLWIILSILLSIYIVLKVRDTDEKATNLLEYRELEEESEA